MIYEEYFENLSRIQKATLGNNDITEEAFEELCAEKGFTFEEAQRRIAALKDGLIGGDPKLLEYPLDDPGRVSAARMYATTYGRQDVLNCIEKLKSSGII